MPETCPNCAEECGHDETHCPNCGFHVAEAFYRARSADMDVVLGRNTGLRAENAALGESNEALRVDNERLRGLLGEVIDSFVCMNPQEADPPVMETCGDCDRCIGGRKDLCTEAYPILSEPCGECEVCRARAALLPKSGDETKEDDDA